MSKDFTMDWGDLAFGSKKPINNLKATFIAATRELSPQRFTQLVKTYLPKGNIVLGVAKEPFVLGFEGQPQFRMLQPKAVQSIIDKVNAASPHKIYQLHYSQRDLQYIFEKLNFNHVVLVSGSWKYTFHTQAPYYALASRQIAFQMVSPFVDEAEALAFDQSVQADILHSIALPAPGSILSEQAMLGVAAQSAKQSYDTSFQTGVALGKQQKDGYRLLTTAFNKVVPFQTFAMHHGTSRERHLSPPHDLNHYDTVHAEAMLLIEAQKQQLDLRGTTLFINLLPCPPCSRMLSETDIAEFVYATDHSDGYAVSMLQKAGKQVRRVVGEPVQ